MPEDGQKTTQEQSLDVVLPWHGDIALQLNLVTGQRAAELVEESLRNQGIEVRGGPARALDLAYPPGRPAGRRGMR